METIAVLIVDDHPLFRQGLRDVLSAEDDLEVIGEAEDGERALAKVKALKPDVVIMDVNIPSLNGIQATKRLKSDWTDVAVIILTAYDDDEQIYHAVRAGASAYYPKDVAPDTLIEAIRLVNRGKYVIDQELLDAEEVEAWLEEAIDRFGVVRGDVQLSPLSPREMEILHTITRGLSNKEIAYTLGISHQTVKNHITSILRKLDVEDRTQAAVFALKRGWVRLQDTDQD